MDCSFFGVQLVVKPPVGDPFQSEIERLIKSSPVDQTLADKRVLHTNLSYVLRRLLPACVAGYWDLIRDSAKAQQEFDTWCQELEVSLNRPAPFGGAYRQDSDSFCIITVAFLVQRGSNTDLTLGERCNIPESQYFTRATFLQLIDTLPLLNFATVAGDAIYLVPGPGGVGPKAAELREEGYQYLKALQ